MGEYANHANMYFPNEIEKWQFFAQKNIKWKTKFWVGKIFSISIKLQIFTDMYITLSFTHTHSQTHPFFLSHTFRRFSLRFWNVIKYFLLCRFPFNDAMKYASNACYLPAINVHVSFFVFFLSLSNNLTLIDSVRILFHDSLT